MEIMLLMGLIGLMQVRIELENLKIGYQVLFKLKERKEWGQEWEGYRRDYFKVIYRLVLYRLYYFCKWNFKIEERDRIGQKRCLK